MANSSPSLLRSVFSAKKPQTSALPSRWPSPLHSKCNKPDCYYPNPPQVAQGVYDCQGIPGGFYCEGTYKVTASMAEAADRFFKEEFRIQAANKRRERIMEKRRYEDEHYKQAQMCHHDDHPRVKLVMNPNARYEDASRRQRVVSESIPQQRKADTHRTVPSRRERITSETSAQPAKTSLHRRDAQRKRPDQECVMPGVKQYYQHHAPANAQQASRNTDLQNNVSSAYPSHQRHVAPNHYTRY